MADLPEVNSPVADRQIGNNNHATPGDYDYQIGDLDGDPATEPIAGVEVHDEHHQIHDTTCPLIAGTGQGALTCHQQDP